MITRAFIAIVLAAVVSATATAQKTVEQIVARVNGDIILKSELADAEKALRDDIARRIQETPAQRSQLEQAMTDQLKDTLRDLIDTNLMLQKAKEMGLNADLEIVKTMEQIRQQNSFPTMEALEQAVVEQGLTVDDFKQRIRSQYLRQQVVSRDVYPKVIVTTEEIRNYYESHKQQFDKPAGVQIREVVVSTEGKKPEEIEELKKKAEDALAAINRGDDFAEVAQKYSDAQTAQNGGDLGFFEKGQLAKPLEDILEKLEKGKVTDVITMPYGFIILKLEDKHDGGILPFEIAQNEIQNTLFQQRVQPKIREYLTKLRVDGFIDVKPGYVDTGAAETAKVSESNPAKN